MDLHTSKEPDWANIDPEDQNFWQRHAAATNGWVAPANAVSLTGAALTIGGLVEVTQGNIPLGVALIAVGRSLDIADGYVADYTKTKSPTGEAVDAGLDKVQIFAALAMLWSEELVSTPVAASFLALNGANVVFTGLAKLRDREIHPSQSGKLSTFGQWGTIGMSIIASSLDSDNMNTLQSIAEYSTAGLAVASTVLGVVATVGYKRDVFDPEPSA